ncbi:hypothetical protein [Actinosynnema sp. NPDC023587]|uniref:hypothetical protein n=1 Tax=Actinosynnema sp. NPDC023587 TaxID=3154695 RepID=UPI0033CAB22B
MLLIRSAATVAVLLDGMRRIQHSERFVHPASTLLEDQQRHLAGVVRPGVQVADGRVGIAWC